MCYWCCYNATLHCKIKRAVVVVVAVCCCCCLLLLLLFVVVVAVCCCYSGSSFKEQPTNQSKNGKTPAHYFFWPKITIPMSLTNFIDSRQPDMSLLRSNACTWQMIGWF